MLKKFFYRRANAIFGKVGRVSKEDVVLHLKGLVKEPGKSHFCEIEKLDSKFPNFSKA